MIIEPEAVYTEARGRAKIAGQILTGVGGVGGAVEILVDLFRRKLPM